MKHQLVTLTINAEEFERFQKGEAAFASTVEELRKVTSQYKFALKDELQQKKEIQALKEDLEKLEHAKGFIDFKSSYGYWDYYGNFNMDNRRDHEVRHWEISTVRDVKVTLQSLRGIEYNVRESLRSEYSDKLNKIPRWIRKIYGAV